MTAQLPTVAVVDEQSWVAGQPLPSAPRQPAIHFCVVALQIRPEVVLPQSESLVQPQVSVGKQALPLPAAEHAVVLAVVHSTQVECGPQSIPLPQSASAMH